MLGRADQGLYESVVPEDNTWSPALSPVNTAVIPSFLEPAVCAMRKGK